MKPKAVEPQHVVTIKEGAPEPEHEASKHCWCEPELIGKGIYLHKRLH